MNCFINQHYHIENTSTKSNSEAKSIYKLFKSFYLNLPGNLLTKLRKTPNQYTIKFASDYYKKLSLFKNLKLNSTTDSYLFKLLKNVEFKKAAGIDQISAKF